MTCYICDPERTTVAARQMPDDEYGEGCTDCERDFWRWARDFMAWPIDTEDQA